MTQPSDQWSAAFAAASLAAMQVYDELIATLFVPFAHDLVDRLDPPPGCDVLDVACGSGVVARSLAARIGRRGRVVATDISPAMLQIARDKPVDDNAAPIEWIEGPAAPLPVDDDTADVLTCQQGLQFFGDKTGALAEMRRALREGGRAAVTAWTGVQDQPVFSALHGAIDAVAGPEIAARYLGPWSLPGEEAAEHARVAGFASVELERITLPVELPGGTDAAVRTLAASGIAREIRALDDDARAALVRETEHRIMPHLEDGTIRATLTTSLLLLS